MGYMSPEQVRGDPVDARSDLFSLGLVLYEMLAGRRAFQRDTAAETMTAILREDPPSAQPGVGSTAARVPAGVERIVTRCLEKSREERFQSARDLGFALEATSAASRHHDLGCGGGGTRPRVPELAPRSRSCGWVRGSRWAPSSGADSPTAPRRSRRGCAPSPSPASDRARGVSRRPDRGLHLLTRRRRPASGSSSSRAAARPRSPRGPTAQPRFSPDGSTVLFLRDEGDRRSVYRIGLVGGAPRRLADDALKAEWFPDGRRLAMLRRAPGAGINANGLVVRDTESGSERTVFEVQGQGLYNMRVSPDGKKVVVIQEPDHRHQRVPAHPDRRRERERPAR